MLLTDFLSFDTLPFLIQETVGRTIPHIHALSHSWVERELCEVTTRVCYCHTGGEASGALKKQIPETVCASRSEGPVLPEE